ncbi:MAG: hypothetical protein EOM70_04385 [Clostridia bacterium]|nr:hypothetical protein [Clostridia bacterium]
MLDVGVYPHSMAQFYIGSNPLDLAGHASIDLDTDVDRHFAAIATYGADLIATFVHQSTGNGLEHEARGVKAALEAGLLECAEIPWEDTLAVMKQMTGLLESWGASYEEFATIYL